MRLKAGELNQRIVLVNKTAGSRAADGGEGAPTESTVTVAASVRQSKTTEDIAGQEPIAIADVEFLIRFSPVVNQKTAIRYGAREFDIIQIIPVDYVKPRHGFRILARERGAS